MTDSVYRSFGEMEELKPKSGWHTDSGAMDSLYKSLQNDLEEAKLQTTQQNEVVEFENNSENFMKLLNDCLEEDYEIVQDLDRLLSDARYYHANCNIAKTTGTAASCGGAAIMIGSFVSAPLTAGLSAIPAVVGAGLSLSGGVTNLVTDFIANRITQGIINEIKEKTEKKQKSNNSLNMQINNVRKILTYFGSQGISQKCGLTTILKAIANETLDLTNLPNTNIMKTFALSAVVMHEAEDVALKYLPKIGKYISISEKHLRMIYSFFGLTNTGTSILKTAAGLIGVVSAGVFAIVDISLLIRDWQSNPPSEKAIIDIKTQLLAEIDNLKELQEIIESLKDKVWHSKLLHIPIVGPSEEVVNRFIANIENSNKAQLDAMLINLEQSNVLKNVTAAMISKAIEVEKLIVCSKVELKLSYDLVDQNTKDTEPSVKHIHIIHQSVLNIFNDITQEFIKSRKLKPITVPNNETLSDSIKKCIDTFMVAKIDDSTQYIDLHTNEYLANESALKKACVRQTGRLYDCLEPSKELFEEINIAVKNINDNSLFVDQMALRIWLKQKHDTKRNRLIFDRAENEIKHMFYKLQDDLSQWVETIKYKQ